MSSSNMVVSICLDEDGALTVQLHAPLRPDGASAHALEDVAGAAVKAFLEAATGAAPFLGAAYTEDDDEAADGDD
jgi:hypothetical protein